MSDSARPGSRKVEVTHRTVIRLALPMTLAHISTPLLGFADAAIVGRLGQAHLLGAIAMAAVIFDFVFWGFGFLRLGTAGLTAQAVGAGDFEEQQATTARALVIALGLGTALIALQVPIAWIAFSLMSASPAATEAAKVYFDIRIWSAPFALVNYVVLGSLTGRGRTDLGLALQILINLSNIVVNIWLVAGLGLGVRGSALGTVTAEVLGAAVGIGVLVVTAGRRFDLSLKVLLEPDKLRRMVGVNRDIMIRSAALLVAFAFFTAQGARGGDITLAANAVLMNLFLITSYFLDGFATAAEQMCGQSLGASDPAGFRKAVRLTSLWCVLFSVGASMGALLGGPLLIDVVSTNEAVRALARQFLVYAALTPVVGALAFEFDGVFIGATWTRDMRNLMLVALVVYFGLFLVMRPLGNTGLWLALLGFLAIRGALQAWRYGSLVEQAFPAMPHGSGRT